MTNKMIIGNTISVTTTAASTQYINLECSVINTTEGAASVPTYVGLSGNVVKYGFLVTANSTSASSTVTLRKGTADVSGSSITVNSAATGWFDVVFTGVAVVNSDDMHLKIVTSGTGTLTIKCVRVEIQPDDSGNYIRISRPNTAGQSITANAVFVNPEQMAETFSTTEANVKQCIVGVAGTLKYLHMHVGGGGGLTMTISINGSPGNATVAPTSSSGFINGSLNGTDTFAQGDLITFKSSNFTSNKSVFSLVMIIDVTESL